MNQFNAEINDAMSFSIKKTQANATGFSFLFSGTTSNKWNDIKLSFLLSSRPDIELATAGFVSEGGARGGEIKYNLKKNFSKSGKLEILSFLTGFSGRSSSGSIGYLINNQFVIANSLIINFSAEDNTLITNLNLDIILFDPLNSRLRFQHRQLTTTFISAMQIDYLPPAIER